MSTGKVQQCVCCIVEKGTVEGLLAILNSIQLSFKFTMEMQMDGYLHFCDTLPQKKRDGKPNVTVYR